MANVSIFFLTVTQNLNIHYVEADTITFREVHFLENVLVLKSFLTAELEIKYVGVIFPFRYKNLFML
jgi:hypothetical protein